MKVLLVAFWPRFEFIFERAQLHLDAGDDVTVMECRAELAACYVNVTNRPSVCSRCRQIRNRAFNALSSPVKRVPLLHLSGEDVTELKALKTRFSALDELTRFCVEEFEIGRAVASALNTILDDTHIDVTANEGLIADFLVSSLAAYRSVQNYLRRHRPDHVYLFNGRVSETQAVVQACRSAGVPFSSLETGHDKDHYGIYENVIPHDLAYVEGRIWQFWESPRHTPEEKERLARQYYLDRSKGVAREYWSFVTAQQEGVLPRDFSPEHHNVVIFNSSETEIACLGDEWRNPVYRDQLDGLTRIRRDLDRLSPDVRVYLRIHPNLKNSPKQVQILAGLAGPRFHVILPGDPVSTYALMRAGDTVLTFGSTTGIEAVFWGKPSVLAGVSYYRNLGGNYLAESHEEVLRLLQAPLDPKPVTAALIYGYYMSTYGTPFRHYRADDLFGSIFKASGAFLGVRFQESKLAHYAWAVFHRLPILERPLKVWHRRRAYRKLYST
jgi:hypothetical protein